MVDSPYPFSLTLPQTDTEAILTARLEELGGSVERGTALESFAQDDDAVHAAAEQRRDRRDVLRGRRRRQPQHRPRRRWA